MMYWFSRLRLEASMCRKLPVQISNKIRNIDDHFNVYQFQSCVENPALLMLTFYSETLRYELCVYNYRV